MKTKPQKLFKATIPDGEWGRHNIVVMAEDEQAAFQKLLNNSEVTGLNKKWLQRLRDKKQLFEEVPDGFVYENFSI